MLNFVREIIPTSSVPCLLKLGVLLKKMNYGITWLVQVHKIIIFTSFAERGVVHFVCCVVVCCFGSLLPFKSKLLQTFPPM